MENKTFSISAIICTKDRKNDLAKLIKSLRKQTILPNELIIIDASKDKKTYELINEKCKDEKYYIKYIKSNPGLTRQRNIGVKESKCRLLLFLDDDVVLDKKFIEAIIETFRFLQNYNIGGISGRITNISNNKNRFNSIFKTIFFLTDIGKGKLKLSGFPEHRNDNKLALVEVLTGCCMVYSRDVFSKYSFDETFSGYSYLEDVDFSYRVSKEFILVYQPYAKLKHFSTTFIKCDSQYLRKMMIRNHFYIFKKNIPKDIPHIFAFIISIIGLFLGNAFLLKDLRACRGILEGLLKPL